ncbi:EAL domain-containing protein [Vibrio sp. TBV020]|uniref:EAL domain-containing protein n=1 Tax=Vibrio sp. TBV020 TaxID=3137398 RepID=UPI0038CDA4EC
MLQVIFQHIAIVIGILISFQVSSLFELHTQRVHILSFTAGFIAAVFITERVKALPAVIFGLLFHYLYISQREPSVAVAFSLLLPTVIYVFTRLLVYLNAEFASNNFTMKAICYLCIMVVVYPIVMTVSIILVTQAFNYPFMDDLHYYGYAILSSSLTQVLLTPMFLVLLSYFDTEQRTSLIKLDNEMRERGENHSFYKPWIAISSIILLAAFIADDLLTLNALCIILVPVIGVGLGSFGYLQPAFLTLFLSLISTYSSVNAFDSQAITIETFYSLIAMLFTITSVIFLMIAQAIKNHLTLKKVILSERRDPYTKLFSLAQLQDDVQLTHQPILILIDLSEITQRLKTLGLAGKGELVQQLSRHLSQYNTLCQRAYIAPFTTSLIYLSNRSTANPNQLHVLHDLVANFSFEWQERSIKILNPKIIHGDIPLEQDIGLTVSELCSYSGKRQTFLSVVEVELSSEQSNDISKLSQIQSAFDNDAFELYCQPYRSLQESNSALSFEVLLRLPSSTGNVLAPAEFFPLIHEFGLEVELDKWVIHHTFKTLHHYVNDWNQIEICCINLTAQALTHVDLDKQIVDTATLYQIPLNKICFEITESKPLDDELQASINISALQSQGCKIALDDFGTGYASFDYLRRIPVDVLKIDGSFVEQIDKDETDKAIVSNISHIAQSMGLKTVAEFVESECHAEILTSLNIHYGQGYGIAKPRPLAEELSSLYPKPKVIGLA